MTDRSPKENEPLPEQEPASKAPSMYESANVLERTGMLEKSIELIQQKIEFVTFTNSFILVVLLVGFLTLLFSLIGIGVSVYKSNDATQAQLIRSVDQLNNKLNSR